MNWKESGRKLLFSMTFYDVRYVIALQLILRFAINARNQSVVKIVLQIYLNKSALHVKWKIISFRFAELQLIL